MSEELDISNEPNFLNFLNKLGDLYGGNKTNITGNRTLNKVNKVNIKYDDTESLGIKSILEKELRIDNLEQRGFGLRFRKKTSRHNTSRQKISRQKKLSSELHDKVIEMIIKAGYPKEKAIYIKAGLYNKIKIEFPDLSNLKKAEKLKEMATQKEIDKIAENLDELIKIVDDARLKKSNNTTTQPIKKEKKTKIPSSKKLIVKKEKKTTTKTKTKTNSSNNNNKKR